MRVDLFDFDLPETSIALRPAEPRDAARLLVVRPGASPDDCAVRDLPGLLRPGDALVFNDTRVVPAQLAGHRARAGGAGAAIEALLFRRDAPDRYTTLARPAKRLKPGDTVVFEGGLSAIVTAMGDGGEVTFTFDRGGEALDAAIAATGHVPLPPYIAGARGEEARDRADYQTVYARHDGSVAAPTAGLHFTPELLTQIEAAGIATHFVTLHVGPGTFLPVKAEDTRDHRMHAEWGEVSAATASALAAVRQAGRRVVAIGTTSMRLLESAAAGDGTIRPFAAETDIFITPGFRFLAVDALMTNFHLPRSTLFMLVSAFSGLETMRAAYAHAIRFGYRFYSYGDASLLFPAEAP